MRDNEHVKAIREALEEAHNLTFEGDTIGVRRALSGPRNVHLAALAAELAEATARAARLRISYLRAEDRIIEECGHPDGGDDDDINTWYREAYRDGLQPGDLDAAPGDTAGERP